MHKTLSLLFACFALSACAPKSDSIPPTFISTLDYEGQDCPALEREASRLALELSKASEAQDNARSWDVLGLMATATPLASKLGGNKQALVGEMKGRVKAVDQMMKVKDCGIYAHML